MPPCAVLSTVLFTTHAIFAGSFTLPPVAPGRQGQQGSTRPAVKGSTATVAPDAQMGTPTNADARIGEVPYTKLNPAVLQGQLAHVVKVRIRCNCAFSCATRACMHRPEEWIHVLVLLRTCQSPAVL